MILIVEDDPQVARLISLVLQRNGYQGETVADGRVALERVLASAPELVIADLTVKGIAGDALCKTIKGEESTRRIPFIVLSGDRDLAEKATGCGADAFLGKPFEFEDLIRLVKRYATTEKRPAS